MPAQGLMTLFSFPPCQKTSASGEGKGGGRFRPGKSLNKSLSGIFVEEYFRKKARQVKSQQIAIKA